MASPVRILHLEDDPNDAELVRATLAADGLACEVARVETRAEFLAAVEQGGFDLILADYSLPAFDGLSALAIAREKRPEAPFLFISGTLGEEVAIETLKSGATDYVLKGRLTRLAPAVRRALREAEDRAERVWAEAAIRQSEARYRTLVEQASDGIFIANAEGQYVDVNTSGCAMLGYSRAELLRLRIADLVPSEDLASVSEGLAELRAGKTLVRERRLKRKDGALLPVEISSKRLPDGRLQGIVRDITERKRVEQEIRLLQTVTQAISEAPDFHSALRVALQKVCEATGWDFGEAWIPRPDGSALELSPAWYGSRKELEKLRRFSEDFSFPPGVGLPGRVWSSKRPEWVPDVSVNEHIFLRAQPALEAGLKAGLAVPIRADDQVLAVLGYFTSETHAEDRRLVEIVSAVAVQLGLVLQRKAAEAALQANERQLSLIYSNVSDVLFYLAVEPGDHFRFVSVNSAFLKATGLTEDQVVGKLVQEVIPEPAHALVLGNYTEAIRTKKTVGWEEVSVYPAGKKYGDVSVTPIFDASGNCTHLIGTVHDITERKRAEEALRESEERYRSLFENMLDGFAYCQMLFDDQDRPVDFVYLNVNGAFERLTGLKNVVGKQVTEVIPGIKESSPELFEIYGRVALTGKPERFEIDFKPLARWLSISVYSTEKGYLVAVFDNITERKQAEAALAAKNEEIRAMTQQLWQTAKLATMGELAASIAHELNNPLATVSLRVESLLAQTSADDPKRRALEIVEQECERMGTLVANLLQFSRRGPPQISTVDVREEIAKTLELIHYHLRNRNIAVVQDFAPDVPMIQADRQQLRQLFLNLFTNASDAMPKGGTLTIRVGVRGYGGMEETPTLPHLPTPTHVFIEVADTGVGIAPDDLPKVMEPFFTTKPEGKGTGLGLAICRRIVQEHNGTLDLASEGMPGRGTTVRITLPGANGTNEAFLKAS